MLLMNEALDRSRVRIWLAVVGTATLVLGAAYAMVQQSTRLAANDLPLATAQTIKHELENGASASDVVSALKTDLKDDSSVFVIVTDGSKHILASSATLNGQTPLPPQGVFEYTAAHGTDHFTWQPTSGVRLASYVLTYGKSPNDGFVIAGQSLKQAEDRTITYGYLTLAAWIATLAWTSFTLLFPMTTKTKK